MLRCAKMLRRHRYVLVAIGTDRPGIVSAVSKVLYTHGGNLEDSRMARLGNQFVMLLRVSLPMRAALPPLTLALQTLERRMRLTVSLQPQSAPSSLVASSPSRLYLISVYGADHPGIVYRVTEWLAHRRVNITDLSTRLVRQGQRAVYLMSIEVQLPRGLNVRRIKDGLSQLERTLAVTLAINPVEPMTL